MPDRITSYSECNGWYVWHRDVLCYKFSLLRCIVCKYSEPGLRCGYIQRNNWMQLYEIKF